MTRCQTVTLVSEAFGASQLLSFPSLLGIPGFAHAVTTRPWNLATHRGPDAQLALGRRRQVCEHLGLPFERLTAPEQIHDTHVLRVLEADVGAGRDGRQTALRFVDGLICDLPRVPIMLFSADCPMILVVEPRRRIFGAAHASWRGTLSQITSELIRRMSKEFAAEPGDLVAAICPCAGPVEYEVGDEVYRLAQARWSDAERFFPTVGGRRFFDLRAANRAQLIDAGVQPARIAVAAESTMSDARFYSHRRDGPETGRFALVAGFQ